MYRGIGEYYGNFLNIYVCTYTHIYIHVYVYLIQTGVNSDCSICFLNYCIATAIIPSLHSLLSLPLLSFILLLFPPVRPPFPFLSSSLLWTLHMLGYWSDIDLDT